MLVVLFLFEIFTFFFFLFFFFFQAEDGIRDLTVTGVQTCALPISCRTATAASARRPTAPHSPPTAACRQRTWSSPRARSNCAPLPHRPASRAAFASNAAHR